MKAGETTRRGDGGIVLVVVLFFVLLLTAAIATFLRRAALDAGIATHRDRARAAESLARGGVRLGETLLLEGMRIAGAEGGTPDSLHDVWARVRGLDLEPDPDAELFLEIEDAAAVFNLNGVLVKGEVPEQGRDVLEALLDGVIAVMPERPGERIAYDAVELAANLADWLDADDVTATGELEDERYASRNPPYRAANQPLLSVEELRLVDGFDGALVDALRPFVGVFPLAGGGGINVNTAPPWVLALLQRGSEVSGMRLVETDDVERIVEAREEGPLCAGEATAETCRPLSELLDGESLQPPPTERSNVFRIRAVARVFDVERSIESVVDRSDPAALERLSWRVR
jgi:general secretion pathway protein K